MSESIQRRSRRISNLTGYVPESTPRISESEMKRMRQAANDASKRITARMDSRVKFTPRATA